MYIHFYNRNNIDKVQEEVKGTFVKNYRINKLEREVKFSDTFSNKTELADEHSKVGNYGRAIELYASCKEGMYSNDTHLIMKLIRNHYLNEDFEEAINYGNLLTGNKEFLNSEEKTAFAWSHSKLGDTEKAEEIFREMDIQFSNYPNRIEYIYFLEESGNNTAARIVTEKLMDEIQAMDSHEKRLNQSEVKEIKRLVREILKE